MLVIFACIVLFSSISLAQEIDQPLSLTDQDISDTINNLKTDNPTRSVELYKKKMPAQVEDEKIRKQILTSQPKRLYELQINDKELEAKVRGFIKPVVKLYGREQYTIVIIRHETPYIMLDAGVLLVISTGIFAHAESDDEILGYIAHEVGHDYYTDYAIYTKHLFGILKTGGREPAIARRFADVLALLELQCDAFSAITLAYLGYDPTAFISGMERSSKKYKSGQNNYHPPESVRRQVVEGVVPREFGNPYKRKMSQTLQEIKDLVKPKPIILKPLL